MKTINQRIGKFIIKSYLILFILFILSLILGKVWLIKIIALSLGVMTGGLCIWSGAQGILITWKLRAYGERLEGFISGFTYMGRGPAFPIFEFISQGKTYKRTSWQSKRILFQKRHIGKRAVIYYNSDISDKVTHGSAFFAYLQYIAVLILGIVMIGAILLMISLKLI